MEKDQVTFVVQASGIGRPLPDPIALLGLSTMGGFRDLVVMFARDGAFTGATRFTLGNGPMTHEEAQLVANAVGDATYNYLLNYIGIQGSFEGLPQA